MNVDAKLDAVRRDRIVAEQASVFRCLMVLAEELKQCPYDAENALEIADGMNRILMTYSDSLKAQSATQLKAVADSVRLLVRAFREDPEDSPGEAADALCQIISAFYWQAKNTLSKSLLSSL